MKMYIRVICAVLVLVTFCGVICSCSGDENGKTATTTAATTTVASQTTAAVSDSPTEPIEIVEDLPEVDMQGKTFKFFMRNYDFYCYDQVPLFDSTDRMDKEVYERNLRVEERFKCEIVSVRAKESDYSTEGIEPILTNSADYDIVVPHGRAAVAYAIRGALVDYSELTYCDLSKPWWAADALEAFTIANRLYFMAGDISYMSFGATVGMIFNKQRCTNLQLEYPYEMVENYEWTFENFAEYVAKGSDINGKAELGSEDDHIGYTTMQWRGPMTVLYSGGGRIVELVDGLPTFAIDTPRNEDIYSAYFEMIEATESVIALLGTKNSGSPEFYKCFTDGNILFTDARLYDISYVSRDMEDYGIIPWPMFDNNEDAYHSMVDSVTNLICIPISNKDLTNTSILLEALSAEGYRKVIPTFYGVVLGGKYAKDNMSLQMLALIKDGRVFDFGMFNTTSLGAYASAGFELAASTNRSFYDYIVGKAGTARSQVENFPNTWPQ